MSNIIVIDHNIQLQKSSSMQEYNVEKQENGTGNQADDENNDLFTTSRSLKTDLDNIRPNDLYDLRMGESSYSMNQDDSLLEDQVSKNHALRAEIEDYRQRLIESEQVFAHYKRVLKNEISMS